MAKNVVEPETFIDHGLLQNPEVKKLETEVGELQNFNRQKESKMALQE